MKYVSSNLVIMSAFSKLRHLVHRSSPDLGLAVGKVQYYMTTTVVMCCVASHVCAGPQDCSLSTN